jgi:hypothetical protein
MKTSGIGYPKILKDGSECSVPDCSIISWDASTKEVTFNVTSFSDYTAAEANQSKVQNNGTNNMSFYLLMKTEYWDGASWNLEDVVINGTKSGTLRNVSVDDLLKLDTIWNAQNYNSSNLSNGDGRYRVYVVLEDGSGNVLSDEDSNNLEASFNFTFDNAEPSSIVLNAPDDDALIADTANNVSFNWTAIDSLDDSLTCNLTIDSVVEGENVQSDNGTMANYTVSDLTLGDHFWNVTCWDDAGNSNISETRNVSIYQTNTAPNTPTPEINSTDESNRSNQDLHCYDVLSDDDADTMNVTVEWYKEDVFNFSADYNDSYANGTLFVATLNKENTTKYQNWSCGIRFYDGQSYSSWANSSELKVLNTLPTVSLTNPPDGNITSNRTLEFSWSGTDADDDSLEYEINITCYESGSFVTAGSIYEDKSSIGVATTYIPSSYLKCLVDNGQTYNWTVRAYDGEGYGNWTTIRNLSIRSSIIISLPLDNVNFGDMNLSEIDNTTDDSPQPILLRKTYYY